MNVPPHHARPAYCAEPAQLLPAEKVVEFYSTTNTLGWAGSESVTCVSGAGVVAGRPDSYQQRPTAGVGCAHMGLQVEQEEGPKGLRCFKYAAGILGS